MPDPWFAFEDQMAGSEFRPAPQVNPVELEEVRLEAADVDDFRIWWEQGLAQGTAEGRPRGWKLTPAARAVVGVIAIIGSVLALKGGAHVLTCSPITVRSIRSFQTTRPLLSRATPAHCQGRTARSRRRTRSLRNHWSIRAHKRRQRRFPPAVRGTFERFNQWRESQTRHLLRKRSTPRW